MKSQLFVKPIKWRIPALMLTAAIATSAIATYSVLRYSSAATSPLPSSTQKSELEAIAALGYLEPQGEVIKLSAPAFVEGARVDQLLVKQGDKVKVKQVIAILDSRDRLQAALAEAQIQVKIAQGRLAQVLAGAKQGDIGSQNAKFQRTQAELEGQIATQRATIASLKAQLQGEKNAQEATIERIKAELRNAQNDCQRYRTLYKEGAVSIQERDRFCLEEKTTKERFKEAQANLKRIVSTLQAQINEAQANLERTITTLQRQITSDQATLSAVTEVRPVDVQVAQAELEAAKAATQKAKADLLLAYVRSPRDGQVLKVHTWPGEIVGEKGIVELGQTDQMYVTAQVYETDISQVRIGQQAIINSDGIVGDLQGAVAEIGLQIGKKDVLGTDPVADADARVVEVKIRLNPEASQRVANLTNLQVNVVIETSTAPKSSKGQT